MYRHLKCALELMNNFSPQETQETEISEEAYSIVEKILSTRMAKRKFTIHKVGMSLVILASFVTVLLEDQLLVL